MGIEVTKFWGIEVTKFWGIEVTKFWEIESNKKTNRFIFISSGNLSGKYYILEQQRERT